MPRGTKKTSKKKPRAGKPRKVAAKAKQSKVKYAKVPKQFEPKFARAQDFVSKYFDDLKGDARHGTIEASGERYLLVRTASMSVDFFETIRGLYKGAGEKEALDVARNLLFDIAHSIGRADAKSFHKKMKLDDPVEKLSAGPIHFAYSGWAFVDIFPESKPTPDENYYLIYDHPYSFESAAWLKAKKKSDCPVCTMNAGYSSGWCEESFGVTLVAKEIMCKAAGDEACRFIMAPPSKIEAHIQKYLKKKPALLKKMGTYEVPGFFKRKQIEMDLRESEEQFRLVFENANDAIFWADAATGIITNCNRSAEELLEKSREDIIGIHQTELHSAEKAEYFAASFRECVEQGKGFVADAEVITSSGRLVPVQISMSVTTVGNRQIIQGIFRDISESKRAEGALRQEKEFTEKVIESLTHPFYVVNASDHTIKMANKAAGFGELTDAFKCYELTHHLKTPCSDKENCPLEIVKKTKKPAVLEHQHRDKNGAQRYHEVHGYPIFDQEGNVVQMIEYTLDITERKIAEAALQASEKKYRDLLENIPCMVYQGSKDWSVTMVGPYVEELTGYAAEEFEQRRVNWLDLIHPDDRGRVVDEAAPIVSDRANIEQEYRITRRDGEERWVRDNKRAIVENGDFAGVDGFVVDVTERKRMEEELRAARNNMEQRVELRTAELRTSQQLYQTLAEAAEDYIYIIGSDMVVRYVNEFGSNALNRSKDEIVGERLSTIFPSDASRRMEKAVGRVFSSGEAVSAENPLQFPDREIWLHTHLVPLKDENGKVASVMGLSRDVTKRREYEDRLRLTQTTMDHVGNAIYWMGPDARFVYVNDQACRQLGYSRKELLTMSVMDIDSSFTKSTWPRHWADIKERMSFVVESVHRRKDGTEFPIEVMVNYLEQGGREFNCAIVLDITERKEAEEALKASERRFQQVAESAEEWIWEVNKHGFYTYSNEVVEEILGYKSEEIVGMMHFYDFFIPEDKEELKKAAFGVFEKKEPFKGFENVNVHKAGRHVILETSGSPMIDSDGDLIGYRGADTDITERKKAEETLRSALKMKSEFMAMMSHELRTPLTRIISSTHLVLRDRDVALPEKRVNNLNNVLSSSDALLLMINNVLEMARLEGGAVPVIAQDCDLRNMIRTSISSCEGMTEEKDVKIVTNIDDAAATIYTDKEKLGHIIMNLICNGIRYSDRGTIEITAKLSRIQGCVDITVSDEGIGISSEKMPQLFEPFKQLEELAYRRPGGIGLGLAIVKANLDLIGGSIDVKSEVGKGSTFTVTIPREPSEEEDK